MRENRLSLVCMADGPERWRSTGRGLDAPWSQPLGPKLTALSSRGRGTPSLATPTFYSTDLI